MVKRRSLIVYFKNMKALEGNALAGLEKFVSVAYVSPKTNYAILYCDEAKVKQIRNTLLNTKGITEVTESKMPLETFEA